MNVLMIVSWYSPKNAETMIKGIFHYEQSIALQKYCSTALYYPYDMELDCDFCSDKEKGLLVFRRKYKKNKFVKYIQCILDYKKIVKEFKPDIIHGHVAAAAGVIAILMGKIYRIPVVITEHNPIELTNFKNPLMKKAIQWVYHNSLSNICVSQDFRNRIKEIYPREDFDVIYNGIVNPISVEKIDTKFRRDNCINCCIVASFYDEFIKGYQYLLPAIKNVRDRGIAILLHICGGGVFFDKYFELAQELGIEDCCVFYGDCDRKKVYSIVSQMDFNISSSVLECSGVSVQEAMLLGKPLVVTKSGGANSLVNEKTAIVVDKESEIAIADGIVNMVEHLEHFDTQYIIEYATDNFEIDNVSQRYYELYKQLLNS